MATLATVGLSYPSAPLADAGQLLLVGDATVTGGSVTLGDLVRDCPRSLAHLSVMAAPPWGSVQVVTRDEVQKRLYRLARVRARLGGADRVRIRRPGTDRSGEIENLLRRAIEERVAAVEGLSFDLRFPDRVVTLPPGPLTIELDLPDAMEGYRAVRLQVRVDGEPVRRMTVTCLFRRSVAVPVSTRALARGDTLLDGDVDWQVRTFDGRLPRLVTEDTGAGVYRLRRSVPEGTPITAAVVERHPDVEAGQEVALVLRRSSVQVTARARALQTGWKGNRIRVQNLVDKSYVVGRIVAKGVVIYE